VKVSQRPAPTFDPSCLAAPLRRRPRFEMALALALLVGSACRSGDVDKPEAAPAAGGAAALIRRAQDPSKRKPPPASPPWHIPVGPKLAIVPGQGLGPIRFGANLETIERLLAERCEEKREEAGLVTCRYSAHAIEFVLDAAGVKQFRIHRLGRLFRADPKLEYGIFNGSFESGVALGMLPGGVTELLGKPKSIRKVEGENPNQTVEVYEYDGVTLEFDQTSPQKVGLGGVILDRPKK
jgi:hypothetical protein